MSNFFNKFRNNEVIQSTRCYILWWMHYVGNTTCGIHPKTNSTSDSQTINHWMDTALQWFHWHWGIRNCLFAQVLVKHWRQNLENIGERIIWIYTGFILHVQRNTSAFWPMLWSRENGIYWSVLFNSLRPSDAYMRRESNHHWFR